MNKEMNKLLQDIIKYDMVSGLLISLVIMFFQNFHYAGTYFFGICVASINFFINGYIIMKYLGKNKKQWLLMGNYFFRMAFIVLTAFPFRKSVIFMSYYIGGFVSHYIILIFSNIKNRKGSA